MDPTGPAASSFKPGYECSQNEIDKFRTFYLIELDFDVEIWNVLHLWEATIIEQTIEYMSTTNSAMTIHAHE